MKITKDNIKVGDTIKCIEDLVMENLEEINAIKGKEYVITEVNETNFTFTNEESDKHFIEYNDNHWFEI